MSGEDDIQDNILMCDIARGSERALRGLMARYGGALMRYSGHMLGDDHLAEDAVQFIFMQVWQNAGLWKPRAKVKTWLYTIAYRHCLNLIRARKIHVDYDDHVITDESGQNPELILKSLQNKAILDLAMNKLPERQKSALLLRYAEEHSQREAAEIMGLGEKAFESLLSRGKNRLFDILSDKRKDM